MTAEAFFAKYYSGITPSELRDKGERVDPVMCKILMEKFALSIIEKAVGESASRRRTDHKVAYGKEILDIVKQMVGE